MKRKNKEYKEIKDDNNNNNNNNFCLLRSVTHLYFCAVVQGNVQRVSAIVGVSPFDNLDCHLFLGHGRVYTKKPTITSPGYS